MAIVASLRITTRRSASLVGQPDERPRTIPETMAMVEEVGDGRAG